MKISFGERAIFSNWTFWNAFTMCECKRLSVEQPMLLTISVEYFDRRDNNREMFCVCISSFCSIHFVVSEVP